MIDVDKARKEIDQAINQVGRCDSCFNHEVDGEQGQYQSCIQNAVEFLPEELIDYLMSNDVKCPFWQMGSSMWSGYCKEHNKFYALSHIGCPTCWDVYVKQQQEEEQLESQSYTLVDDEDLTPEQLDLLNENGTCPYCKSDLSKGEHTGLIDLQECSVCTICKMAFEDGEEIS